MKKILNIILTFIIVLGLSGCTDIDPLETRLDELELQLKELQTEMDAKDELLDTIILSIANLNDTAYDDASVLELIDSLQLWQDNHADNDTLYDDSSILELIAELQLWQDNVDNAPYNSTVESDVALFKVEVDYIEINSTQEVISVTVEITAKIELETNLGTSTFGEAGMIIIEIVNVADESVTLHSELCNVIFTHDTFYVHLDESEKLTRTLQFARNAINGSSECQIESPEGLYRVMVGLQYPGEDWIYTDIEINVTD